MSSQRKTQYYPFAGGIDTETPALSVRSGELVDGFNHEPVTKGGYRRVDGIERFDGHLLASEAVYHVVNFDNGEHEPNYGEAIQGAASAAQGVLLDVVITSGDWSTNDAAGYMVLWVISGVFISGEVLSISHPEAFTVGFNSGFA